MACKDDPSCPGKNKQDKFSHLYGRDESPSELLRRQKERQSYAKDYLSETEKLRNGKRR